MPGTVYLTLDEVVGLHGAILERMGSPPCPLLRFDQLDSALHRPQNAAKYGDASIIQQAVVLAVAISQAQAFEDGNKRTGFLAADAFLRKNGLIFRGPSLVFAKLLESIAEPVPHSVRRERTVVLEQWLASMVIHGPGSQYVEPLPE